MPDCCVAPVPGDFPAAFADWDVRQLTILYGLTALAESSYKAVDTFPLQLLVAWLGVPFNLQFIPNGTSLVPGTIIAEYPNYCLVVVSGTTTAQQRSLELMFAGHSLTDVGSLSTTDLFRIQAQGVFDRIDAAAIPLGKPFVLVGHSIGGSIAHLMSAQLALGDPTRKVTLLTLGAAKAGDKRMVDLAKKNDNSHVAVEGDPMPFIPPDVEDQIRLFKGLQAEIFDATIRAAFGRFRPFVGAKPIRTFKPSGEWTWENRRVGAFQIFRDAIRFSFGIIGMPDLSINLAGRYTDSIRPSIPPDHDQFPMVRSVIDSIDFIVSQMRL